jgi:hypothetical protein
MSRSRMIRKLVYKLGLTRVIRLFRPRVVSAEYVLRLERSKIEACRGERLGSSLKDAPWCGLGLSGGGIRSACLALGVLQAFAEQDLLRRFDYISSVSGGGYLAGSLQWWWSKEKRDDSASGAQVEFGMGQEDFPYGPARLATSPENQVTAHARTNLHFLRSHSSYLTPGNGLTSWSMLAVLIRTALISLLIWIPLLAGFFAALLFVDHAWLQDWAQTFSFVSPLGDLIPAKWLIAKPGIPGEFEYRTIYALGLYVYYGFVAAFVIAAVVFAFMSRTPQSNDVNWSVPTLLTCAGIVAYFIYSAVENFWSLDASLAVIVLLGALFIAIALTIVIAEIATPKSLNASYLLRRSLEKLLGRAFIPSLFFLATATIPLVPYFLVTSSAAPAKGFFGGVFGVLSGVASAVYGYYSFLRSLVPSLAGQILATVGAILYLYATLVIGYSLAVFWGHTGVYGDWAGTAAVALEVMFFIAFALGIFVNINYVGLHRFYRDRLMEAFMPTDCTVQSGKSSYSPVADNLMVTKLRRDLKSATVASVPYPLINTNVIMVNDEDQKVAMRGGDNFIISPLFVGSSVTGWQDSVAYIGNNGPLTLASSIAASGAAATASAGALGTGITMNPLVASVMSLLNIRLGLWVSNPSRRWPLPFSAIPTFLHPGMVSGILSMRHSRRSRFIELTDGGHFENLGLYELVRRKLPIILIVDGEADPSISLSSFVSVTRRIEQDFKATLTFNTETGKGPERLMMYQQKGYPAGLRYAQSPFLVARLSYSDGSSGTLVYIKSTLIKDMDFTTAGYLAENPTFPHQSTVDQFFDQDQFDAYRFLGYDTASQLIDKLQLADTMASADAIWKTYGNLHEAADQGIT